VIVFNIVAGAYAKEKAIHKLKKMTVMDVEKFISDIFFRGG